MCSQPSASTTRAEVFRIVPVAREHVRAAHPDLTRVAREHVGAVEVLAARPRHRAAAGRSIPAARRHRSPRRDDRRCLGEPVALVHVDAESLRASLSADVDRQRGRARHREPHGRERCARGALDSGRSSHAAKTAGTPAITVTRSSRTVASDPAGSKRSIERDRRARREREPERDVEPEHVEERQHAEADVVGAHARARGDAAPGRGWRRANRA